MGLFSRRNIQAALDRLAGSLSNKQIEGLVARLNAGDASDVLSTQWEFVVLSAFSQIGRIQYEKDFDGQSRPDLFFQMGNSGNFEFVADVTTISDVNAHNENAYHEFCEAIRRFLGKRGHNSAGLDVRVEHEEIGDFGDQKVRLMLPKKGDMDRFVKVELSAFLSKIVQEPNNNASHNYDTDGIRFLLRYDGKEKCLGGGTHLSYTVPYSERRNPLANALKKKSEQLSKSGYKGVRGIIVCDGDCEALKERNAVSGALGGRELVMSFLNSHESVLFVLVLRVDESTKGSSIADHQIKIAPKLYCIPRQDNKRLLQQLTTVINRALKHLPTVESTPCNALRWLAGPGKNVGYPIRNIVMKGHHTIKISARTLTELLAGRIDQKRFIADNNLGDGPLSFRFFEYQLNGGCALKNAFIEQCDGKDDDFIVLEYEPDPALGPYQIPRRNRAKSE